VEKGEEVRRWLEERVREFVEVLARDFGVEPPKVEVRRIGLVAGLYDLKEKKIVIDEEKVEPQIIIHEFIHYLQDVYYDKYREVLRKFTLGRREVGKVEMESEAYTLAHKLEPLYMSVWSEITGLTLEESSTCTIVKRNLRNVLERIVRELKTLVDLKYACNVTGRSEVCDVYRDELRRVREDLIELARVYAMGMVYACPRERELGIADKTLSELAEVKKLLAEENIMEALRKAVDCFI